MILKDIYRKSVEKGFYGSGEVRGFIEHALDSVERSIRGGGSLVVVRAPPGIGKTAIPVTVFLSSLAGELPTASVIHVTPTRSLIDDLASRIRSSLAALVSDGLARGLVARQHGLSHETSSLLAPYTVTTFDTYLYNFLKLPTDEILKIYGDSYGHYEIPRSAILSAFNFLDEVHMAVEESSMLGSAMIASMKALAEFGVPTVVSTATLSTPLINRLRNLIKGVDVVDYEGFIKDKGPDEFYRAEQDKSFKPIVGDNPLIMVKDPCDIDGELKGYIDRIFEIVESGGRASIVVNTVELAKCIYSKLRGRGRAILIYSRFTPEDRECKVEAIKRGGGALLVSTQVLEVGVDISFDAILSQVAPPSSLIQRFGRLARGADIRVGYWAIFASEEDLSTGSGIYRPEAVRGAWETIRNVGGNIHWHLPRPVGSGFRGYMDILDIVWDNYLGGVLNEISGSASFQVALTNPLISSKDVANLFRDIGGLRDENICSIYIYDRDVGEVMGEDLWRSSIPMSCYDMLVYLEKAVGKGYDAYVLERDVWGDISARKLDQGRLRDLKNMLEREPFVFSIKVAGAALPSDLYEGGIYGSGLKDL